MLMLASKPFFVTYEGCDNVNHPNNWHYHMEGIVLSARHTLHHLVSLVLSTMLWHRCWYSPHLQVRKLVK